jgi:exonuclease SbcC
MKTITLKSLYITNFKGVREFKFKPNFEASEHGPVNICGDNRTGKTTTVDAFQWLLFGKNSKGEKEFDIKNTVHKELNRQNHEVIGVICVDGLDMKLGRVYKEKWTKKRGSEEPELTGHETEFMYNDIPVSQSEFKAKVESIVGEELFKLITSPTYFNSLKWDEQRAILSKMAGDISDEQIAGDSEEFNQLLKEITGITLKEFKQRIAANKKIIKDRLATIPARIDEVKRGKKEPVDVVELEKKINGNEVGIFGIDESIDNSTKALQGEMDKVNLIRKQKHELETRLDDVRKSSQKEKRESIFEIEKVIVQLQNDIFKLENENKSCSDSIKLRKGEIEKLTIENNSLREKYSVINASVFTMNQNECVCPTCNRELENADEKRKSLEENFNNDKVSKLIDINEKGIANKELIEKMSGEISVYEGQITNNAVKIQDIQKKINEEQEKSLEIENLPTPVSELELNLKSEIDAIVIQEVKQPDNTELKLRKSELQKEIDAWKQLLTVNDHNNDIDKRVTELLDSEKSMNIELAKLERSEFVAERFAKKRIEEIERRINDKFKHVKWKMFDVQLNGGEKETCECTLDGVPYSTLNTEGRVNAGLDIINALCNHYQVNAPIFIDDRSIVSEIFPTESQVINLINIPGQKLLSIN